MPSQFRNLLMTWAPLWRTKRSWIDAFDSPGAHDARDSALWYSPGRSHLWSSQQWAALSAQLERFASLDTNSASTVAARLDGCAARALSLAQSPEFRLVTQDIANVVTTTDETWTVRMMEDDLRGRYADCPDPPALLETRIGIVVTAAEILRMLYGRKSIHPDIARAVCVSVRNRSAFERRASRGLNDWPSNECKRLKSLF
jgi:hypothetical protein